MRPVRPYSMLTYCTTKAVTMVAPDTILSFYRHAIIWLGLRKPFVADVFGMAVSVPNLCDEKLGI